MPGAPRADRCGSTLVSVILFLPGERVTEHTRPRTSPTRWAARPTTYRGIRMRSRLEALWAAWLDNNGFRWEYEPLCFASPRGQYLPDFSQAVGTVERAIFYEVKPPLADLDRAQSRMSIIWESVPSVVLRVVLGAPDSATVWDGLDGEWQRYR